jgi:hypothetical protein
MKRIVAMIGIAGLCLSLTTGCIGGMAVSGKVTKFNLDVVEGKWLREGVFLLLYFIPVYPIAGMIDLIIVNSIEFHTGTNPISGKPRIARVGETRRVELADGTVSVSTLRADGTIDFEVTDPDGETRFANVEVEGDRLVARDAEGRELALAPRDADPAALPR